MEEADDFGILPDEYRDLLIAQDGSWEVVVTDRRQRVGVALAVKTAFGLDTTAQAFEFARRVPGVVWEGTTCEAEWMRRHLERRDVAATCRRRA